MKFRRSLVLAGLSTFTALTLMLACSGEDEGAPPATTTDSGQADTSSTVDPTPQPPVEEEDEDGDASTPPMTDAAARGDADGGVYCTSETSKIACGQCCKATFPLASYPQGYDWAFDTDAGVKCQCIPR